jgi:hypothetical protein
MFGRRDLLYEQAEGLLQLSEPTRAEDRRDLTLGVLSLCPNDALQPTTLRRQAYEARSTVCRIGFAHEIPE